MSTTRDVSAAPLPAAAARAARHRSLWGDAARQFVKNRLAVAGMVVVVVFILAAAFGPYVAPYDFLAQDISGALQGPSAQHWLGTDELGRDIFSRLLYGARTAAIVSLSTTIISLLIGILVGTAAGFLRGAVDEVLMWLSDLVQAVPSLLLAMLVNTALKRPVVAWFDARYQATGDPRYLNTLWLDFVLVFGSLALIGWPGLARLVRGQVLSISQADFVMAARSIGSSRSRIMRRHVVPNSLGPLIVAVSQSMGGAILNESGLSFLGVGVQPPNASWGSMLNKSLALWQSFPHLMVAPAMAIGLVQVAFIFVGDGLNDALNPRQRRK